MNAPTQVDFDMCARATAFGRSEAGRITGEILKRQIAMPSLFRDRVEKSDWTDGVGYENVYQTYNPRVFEATSDDEMTPWGPGDGSPLSNGYAGTAACQVPMQEVPLMGIKNRKFGLGRKRFRTPLFCAFDLKTKFQADNLLTAYYNTLGLNSSYFMERNIQNAYTRISQHKVIATGQPGIAVDGANTGLLDANGHTMFPAVAPTTTLSQGLLDNIKVALSFMVTSNAPNMLDTAGKMVYDLFTDDLTSTQLVMQAAGTLTNYQIAYQGQGQKSPTIQGIGAFQGMVVNGFRHLYCKYPARWDLVGGQWVRIRPFAIQPTDPEAPQNVTQAYLSAPFQDSYVFLTNVMELVVKKPIQRVGPAAFGSPIKDYAGEGWQWFSNPGIEGCNIDGTNGFWWTDFFFGFKEIDPQCGWTIRHRRCDMPVESYNCGNNFQYGTSSPNGY